MQLSPQSWVTRSRAFRSLLAILTFVALAVGLSTSNGYAVIDRDGVSRYERKPNAPAVPPPPSAFLAGLKSSSTVAPLSIDTAIELDYIRAAQLPSGAFRRRPNDRVIVPYWGNYATIGLGMIAGRSQEAATMGWRWLQWYADHQSLKTGYVSDHLVVASREDALASFDSTDAYAATFLMAVESMYDGTLCSACVERLGSALPRAVDAIASTMDVDGLTWARPEGHVKYLMDQAEVGAGLRSALRLALAFGDNIFAATIDGLIARQNVGLANMVGSGGATVWAIAETSEVARRYELPSARATVDDNLLYPDSLADVFVAALIPDLSGGSIRPGGQIAEQYVRRWPRWKEDPDTWGFPVLVTWAFIQGADRASATTGITALHQLLVDGYRGDALTVGHVGQLLAVLR